MGRTKRRFSRMHVRSEAEQHQPRWPDARAARPLVAMAACAIGCAYAVPEVIGDAGDGGAGGAAGSASSGPSASSGASATGAGATAAGGAGGAGSIPCTEPGPCSGCPDGLECLNGCCEIVASPPTCAEAIDVTAGGVFHVQTCNGPVSAGELSAMCVVGAPHLLLRVETSPAGGASYSITTKEADRSAVRIGRPCHGDATCLQTSMPWIVDENATFSVQLDVDDPCTWDIVLFVTPQ
jgi:hypothetical protein